MKLKEIEKYIDHTLLKPDTTIDMIKKLCDEAIKYNFYSVCISPYYVDLAKQLLKNTEVKICCVVGFPLGSNLSIVKAFETKKAIELGADEIDMVINIQALKNREYNIVADDIKSVVEVASGRIVKVIIETCLLNDDEKIKACEISINSGADFVKTSTGFSIGGATLYDVKLMKKTVSGKCKIKASGQIKSYSDLIQMIEAGADRIGASSSVEIMNSIKN